MTLPEQPFLFESFVSETLQLVLHHYEEKKQSAYCPYAIVFVVLKKCFISRKYVDKLEHFQGRVFARTSTQDRLGILQKQGSNSSDDR